MGAVGTTEHGELLQRAYPSDRERADAEHWLGLIAVHTQPGAGVHWHALPTGVPSWLVQLLRLCVMSGLLAIAMTGAIVVTADLPRGGVLSGIAWGLGTTFVAALYGGYEASRHLVPLGPQLLRPAGAAPAMKARAACIALALDPRFARTLLTTDAPPRVGRAVDAAAEDRRALLAVSVIGHPDATHHLLLRDVQRGDPFHDPLIVMCRFQHH